MKKFFALLLVMMSLSAFAQHRSEGRITTREGRTTVRINIGDNRQADTHHRIRLLEEAVRDLQDQVYDLQDEDRTRVVHVCVMQTNFHGNFIGKGSSRIEAEAIARQKCQRANAPFCSNTKVSCEKTIE